jgi:hypothetical protein
MTMFIKCACESIKYRVPYVPNQDRGMYYSKSDTAVTVDSHYMYNYILFLLMAMASKRGKNLLQLEPYPNLESRSETKARHPDKGLTKSTT